jgi:hypothetical protein
MQALLLFSRNSLIFQQETRMLAASSNCFLFKLGEEVSIFFWNVSTFQPDYIYDVTSPRISWAFCYNFDSIWQRINNKLMLHLTNLMSPSRNSSDPTCNPEISGRRETSLQRRVSYAIILHFLQTRAMRQISRWDKYEKMLSSTLSGSFSIVCNNLITLVFRDTWNVEEEAQMKLENIVQWQLNMVGT